MKTPEAFIYLVRWFHQDIEFEVSSKEELVTYLVKGLGADRRRVVHVFLADLLARDPSGEELLNLWDSTGPDWGFGDGEELRWLLSAIRDATADGPAGSAFANRQGGGAV